MLSATLAMQDEDEEEEEGSEVDLRMARLESLMDRRPLLLSSVLLRQNPHSVKGWHDRANLFKVCRSSLRQ